MSDFRIPLRDQPWPYGEGRLPTTKCPICGDIWIPWAGSMLPCHARCLLTDDAQDRLLDEADTVLNQANKLGVSPSVVRASIFAARRRRNGD